MPSDFDIAAKNYDNVFTFSKIGRAQRNRVYSYLNPIINNTTKKLSILELNCGTGADAIKLANLGHSVLATDISKAMIDVAKAKETPKNLDFKIQDINTISSQTFQTQFDLIFSNFGGLNCLSKKELEAFIKTSKDLLTPNGKLVFVIMPRFCIWERLYFYLKGDLTNAKRRRSNKSVLANIDGIKVPTWYYNPKEIISLAKPQYKPEKIKPIGISVPPSYLEASFISKRPLLDLLIGIEKIFNFSFLAKYADHFLIELTKK
ncbi:class I SAM-dependent methyltransferase [Flavivirga algicola]|uniref:Class I SAM-dependent methyltransferase n=1 Tax=Flavivirga algicola TaxID=2729136 RepID=A0ABX1RW50_9FLAO|nr:class I SAM-dependent methyltransferase [Flavivirga algicola]NMH86662.1 class I SAM-dependent methyltransferase [Flavivirga algicola]